MLSLFLTLLLNCRLFFALHFSGTSSFPKPLPQKVETELFEQLHRGSKERQKDAKDKLVLHNLRLVAHVMKKYYTYQDSQEDLLSIGTIGLIKAVDSFSPNKKIRFATYGAKCIENEILMHFRAQKKIAQDISIQEATATDKEGKSVSLLEKVADPSDLQKEAENRFLTKELLKGINTLLTDQERMVLRYRYGLEEGAELPQREVANLLGISRSYVSRLESKALGKLRKLIEPDWKRTKK